MRNLSEGRLKMHSLFRLRIGSAAQEPVLALLRKTSMSKPFRQSIRYNLHYPLRNAVDELRASFGTIGSDQHRVLIASDDLASTSEEQFAPLMANRPLLFEKLGIIFNQK